MKKKNVFNYATMLFCMLMGLAVTASCSKGDSEEGVDGGSGNTDSYSQYVGKWSGSATSSTGGTWGLIMQLYANKTADFKLLLIGGGSVRTVENTTGKKVVYDENSKTIYIHSEDDLYNVLRVVSISGNNMVLDFIDCTFNMERTSGSGGSSGGGTETGKRCTLCGGTGSCSDVNDNQDHYCHGSVNADGATEASSTGLAQNASATTATARTSANTAMVQANVHAAAATAGCDNLL